MGKTRNALSLAGSIFLWVFTFFAVSMAFLSVRGFVEDLTPANVGIVPGNAVFADGTPAPRLAGRLDRAVELYKKRIFPKIIVSGGVGYSGYEESIAMRDYLVEQGVPKWDIIVDKQGYNTRATAKYAAEYMRERKLSRAIVVSQFFHLARATLALRQEGIADVGAAYSQRFDREDLYSVAREVPAFIAYWLRLR